MAKFPVNKMDAKICVQGQGDETSCDLTVDSYETIETPVCCCYLRTCLSPYNNVSTWKTTEDSFILETLGVCITASHTENDLHKCVGH